MFHDHPWKTFYKASGHTVSLSVFPAISSLANMDPQLNPHFFEQLPYETKFQILQDTFESDQEAQYLALTSQGALDL